MNQESESRLARHVSFLEKELEDRSVFGSLTWEDYNGDRNKRRNVERWVENTINSLVDIAKIILTLEGLAHGDTYRETIARVSLVSGFDREEMDRLSMWVRLRNIISHEYLDIKWSSIERFIRESGGSYAAFVRQVKRYLEKGRE